MCIIVYHRAALPPLFPVMDRCKSWLSCRDSPISSNLICLKNTAFTPSHSPSLPLPIPLSLSAISPLLSLFPSPSLLSLSLLPCLLLRSLPLSTLHSSSFYISFPPLFHFSPSSFIPNIPELLPHLCLPPCHIWKPVIFTRVKILFHHLLNKMCFLIRRGILKKNTYISPANLFAAAPL